MTVARAASQRKRPIDDMEDIGSTPRPHSTAVVSKHTMVQSSQSNERKSWREVLGPPPPRGTTMVTINNCWIT